MTAWRWGARTRPAFRCAHADTVAARDRCPTCTPMASERDSARAAALAADRAEAIIDARWNAR